MHTKYSSLNGELYQYLVAHCSAGQDPLLEELARETEERLGGLSMMQIAPDQGALMTMLTRLVGARRAVEVGTFTGYSSICIARGLAPDGRLITCDMNEEWTDVARGYWQRAGVADKIELRLGPAVETLRALPEEESFEMAFIDADKENYPLYYDEILARTLPGGLILLDNVFWGGQVADPLMKGGDVDVIRGLNASIAADGRVEAVMLPVSDGLTLVRKK